MREAHLPYTLWLLPLGGLLIGWLYHKYGQAAAGGNLLLFDAAANPQKQVPFVMAPLVYVGTIITHALGGSAGREGTAVQMGGAIADAFTPLLKATENQRRVLLLAGISGGFAAVFGTPWAGALFALEVVQLGRNRRQFIVPVMVAAFVADFAAHLTGAQHTSYAITAAPIFSLQIVVGVVVAALLFGLAAQVFVRCMHGLTKVFGFISNPVLRPFIGGLILVGIFSFNTMQDYMGLGIPVIQASFSTPQAPWVFALKLLLTAFTLGAGFKGGEVTPLFFIGAALGSALSVWLPVPLPLLTGLGFAAVFGAASKTPWASALMGAELFGWYFLPYLILACWVARWASGTKGIYVQD